MVTTKFLWYVAKLIMFKNAFPPDYQYELEPFLVTSPDEVKIFRFLMEMHQIKTCVK